MGCPVRSWWVVLIGGCATVAPPSPPEARLPTPVTVTKENPAGDAKEPEDAALTRLLTEPIGQRFDRFHTLMASLPDVANWRRVRIFGHPTRMTYRFGDNHFALDVVDYRPAQGSDSPSACLQRFVERAREEAERYSVTVGPTEAGEGRSRRGAESLAPSGDDEPTAPMPYVRVSGAFTTLFNRDRYRGAAAGHRSWPGTCLVHAFAVRVGTDEALAKRVVERWIDELTPSLGWTAHVHSAPPFEDR